jgi:katanin p60 ATPase-containing subunit A1
MRQKIAGNTRDEIKNMSKDEISKDFVAMCDLMKLHGNTKFILSMSFVWCIG